MILKSILFPALILLITFSPGLGQHTVSTVPNQKLIDGSYVSNPDHILNPETTTQIDSILHSLEDQTSSQIAIVALTSIGDADLFSFAHELFVQWQIGQKENNNGLLILLVTDKHEVRFHTGDGLEGMLPDATCKRIQREFMVPEFKKGDYNKGLLAGIKEIDAVLRTPANAGELKVAATDDDDDDILTYFAIAAFFICAFIYAGASIFMSKDKGEYPELPIRRGKFIFVYFIMPLIILITSVSIFSGGYFGWLVISLYVYFACTRVYRLIRTQSVINRLVKTEEYNKVSDFLKSQRWYWLGAALIFPFPFLGYFFYHLRRAKSYRNHPRQCKQCHAPMRKLDDTAEDEFLTGAMLIEESVKSVDYDVWKCTGCEHIDVHFFLNSNTSYEVCPKCNAIAFHLTNTNTIRSATYSSGGREERNYQCKNCAHTRKSQHDTPQLTRTTSTSSGSSFGNSSSASGGSWGGGSSSGGGASSSW